MVDGAECKFSEYQASLRSSRLVLGNFQRMVITMQESRTSNTVLLQAHLSLSNDVSPATRGRENLG